MQIAPRLATTLSSSKSKSRQNAGSLLNKAGNIMTKDTGRAKVLGAFFGSFFRGRPTLQEDKVREHLIKMVIDRSVGPNIMMLPKMLMELADVIARKLLIICERRGKKEDPGNYRPVSLTSFPGNVMEQQHSKEEQEVALCDEMTGLVDEGRAVDVVYLDFHEAFNTFCHSVLADKLAMYGLAEWTGCVQLNSILGYIRESFETRSRELILPLYKALVRPYLESCVHFWPGYRRDMDLLEAVKHWNRLPRKIVVFPSLEIFRTELDNVLSNLGTIMGFMGVWNVFCLIISCNRNVQLQSYKKVLNQWGLVGLSPSIQPVQVPLQSLPTLKQINTPTQLGVVCKLTEGPLSPLVQIIDKDIKQNWPQY
ncbi:hypothetical protein QYF61_009623 [Mycteria americana]|uniref:Reverse transcriptase domain-containing protein n=1 Tax=Mycteria americana TaxID=33587 RepID=A0AAN7NXE7_MYCAM|nr:hypothetical protein QYF61_009623 [Mycteria americana]